MARRLAEVSTNAAFLNITASTVRKGGGGRRERKERGGKGMEGFEDGS
jgi:hypothetical protein